MRLWQGIWDKWVTGLAKEQNGAESEQSDCWAQTTSIFPLGRDLVPVEGVTAGSVYVFRVLPV